MRSRFIPTAPEPEPFIRSGLIVPDTNVLLGLYRLSPDAREEVLGTLRLVQERLRLPHQVGIEFYRSVDDVRGELDRIYAAVRKQVVSVRSASSLFGDGRRYEESRKGVADLLGQTVDALLGELDALRAADPARVARDSDALLAELEELFEGRLLPQPDPATVQERVRHFVEYRVPNLIPPGYEDAKTKNEPLRAAGDYLIWCELLDLAEQSHLPVLLITDDTKGDWYTRHQGETTGPRPELVLEFTQRSDAGYHQMTLQRFVQRVRDALGASVSETSVEEIGAVAFDSSAVEDTLRELLDAALYRNVADLGRAETTERPLDLAHAPRTPVDSAAVRAVLDQLLGPYGHGSPGSS